MNLYGAIFRRLVNDEAVSYFIGHRLYENLTTEEIYPFAVIDVETQEDDAIDKREADHFIVTIEIVALSPQERNAIAAAIYDVINRQTWEDENVIVSCARLVSENTGTYSDSGKVEKVYSTVTQEYEFIATV